ncbi:twin-arginine translocase subunit TatC [Alphaproteobacteria bacterium]|jgi:sec-independent protein translocase protein TatC|nr:twin-arginine translocase subunit TatC [Alphaproteobacteria bacterium]
MSDDKKPGGISRVASQMQSMFRKKAEETKLETEAGQGPKYLYSDVKDTVIGTEEDPSQAPLMEHLKELRQRLFVFVAVFFALTIGAFFLAKPIYLWLARPIIAVFERNGLPTVFIVTSPFEKFFADFTLALFVGLTLTLPVLLYQIWRFIAPGLYNNEKGAMRPFLVASPILYWVGISFVYFVVMPMAFNFLIGYALDGGEFNLSRNATEFNAVLETFRTVSETFFAMNPAEVAKEEFIKAGEDYRAALRDMAQLRPLDKVTIDPQTKIADYLRDSMRMLIGGGLGFQLPVALTLMVRSGLVSTDFLKRNRKFAVLILFILSGVLTPPDIISQAMLGGPMYLLYEVAILIGGRIEKHQRANNPYWDGGEPDSDADEDAEEGDGEENSIGGDQPGPDMDDDELFAPLDDEEPRILKSTPEPSGDEGFVKPDPNDD